VPDLEAVAFVEDLLQLAGAEQAVRLERGDGLGDLGDRVW
jgi:hypothetical protein